MIDSTDNPATGFPATSLLIRLIIFAALLLLALKIFLAIKLDLYSDEIFYWLASTNLALAYSDLPFMTSLLVWLGSGFDPGSTLAVRSLFLLLGATLPVLIYWLALPVTGRAQALASALLSLCIPLGGFLGLLAVPDVSIIFFGLLSIGLFERCLRSDRIHYWILLGGCVALGLCTHYRFVLYPAAAVLFLLWHRPSHPQWQNPRLWLAIAIASLGLLPILWFNLSNQMASATFYLIERHPWEFRPAGMLHAFLQAGVVTPPLYALLAFTLWRMFNLARGGNRDATMLLCLALVNLLVYLLLAPWTDATSTTLHWPLSGYFPILVYVPATLQLMFNWLGRRLGMRSARRIILAIPVIGFIGTLAGLLGIGSQAYQESLQSIVGRGLLSNKMAGWEEFSAHTAELLSATFPGQEPLIVTDNYYTAAQLAFAGVAQSPRTIDRDKAVRDGRSVQLNLWQMDRESLIDEVGRETLLISEDSALNILDGIDTVEQMCGISRDMRLIDRLSLFGGDKQFSYYRARLIRPEDESGFPADPCPYPPRAWIDPPVAGQVMSGVFHIEGWAFKEDIGVDSVELLLDGEEAATLTYGFNRPDVSGSQGVETDPNSPNLGYAFDLDTTQFANGEYILSIRITDARGVPDSYGERPVEIRN